jgi:hypothetical protein
LRKELYLGLSLGLILALGACGRKAASGAAELLKKGDFAAAQSTLEAMELKQPELASTHFQLFLVYRLLATRAGAKADQLTQMALSEYTWICKHEGLDSDYQRMEETLKASDKTKHAFDDAYALVYTH